eukprot:scaffold102933_cov58-Phaeocystis_antarctica.AAC.2
MSAGVKWRPTTHHSRSPAACSGLPSGRERRALAAWVPRRACVGALLPAQSRRFRLDQRHTGVDVHSPMEDGRGVPRPPRARLEKTAPTGAVSARFLNAEHMDFAHRGLA